MDNSKKGLTNNLTCDVCKIDFNSNADYALHEFSKKHCDNLIRLAKQKPIVSKQKAKSEAPQVEKEQPKINSVTHTGSFAKYGYFVPGEVYVSAETSKEFNTDYDPYLQKFAENPFKEKPNPPPTTETSNFSSVTSFSRKKKKKIKTCQVCNMTLSTVPEYEAHMKSSQHIWKLKVTGMGVSAHFVKASTDLHTTDITEEPKVSNVDEQAPADAPTANSENPPSAPFPLLYCSDCELLLNSPQQYNAHINGKFHLECAQRKAELKAKKEKLENPLPNQLYCYSCKISLNNLFQYNEHKNGKKHKTKCKNLIRKGITIPPEERVPGIPLPNPNKPVVYPELYEKLVLEKQNKKNLDSEDVSVLEKNCGGDSTGFQTENNIDGGFSKTENTSTNHEEVQQDVGSNSESLIIPKIVFHQNCLRPNAEPPVINNSEPIAKATTLQQDIPNPVSDSPVDFQGDGVTKGEAKTEITIINDSKPLKCSICGESFQWQSQLDLHLTTEEHLKKILEVKLNGTGDSEILTAIFSDRSFIKANNMGKLTCSICSVTTDNSVEFDQHLNSIVHKYTLKDYKMKRTLEVKQMVACNEQNLYFCKLCKEGWASLVEYTQHLHFVKHKTIQRTQRAKVVLAKRRTLYMQKQRLMQSLKKRNLSLRRVKTEKNPGVRTKVCGVAVDLNSGAQATVPNLEPLEPKIDITKNVTIGVCGKPDEATPGNHKENAKLSKTKRGKTLRPPQTFKGTQHNDLPPLMSSGNQIPPLMSGPPYRPRFPRPGFPPYRNWAPHSSPYPPAFGPFCNRPMANPYLRPPWFRRPPWPRYRFSPDWFSDPEEPSEETDLADKYSAFTSQLQQQRLQGQKHDRNKKEKNFAAGYCLRTLKHTSEGKHVRCKSLRSGCGTGRILKRNK